MRSSAAGSVYTACLDTQHAAGRYPSPRQITNFLLRVFVRRRILLSSIAVQQLLLLLLLLLSLLLLLEYFRLVSAVPGTSPPPTTRTRWSGAGSEKLVLGYCAS